MKDVLLQNTPDGGDLVRKGNDVAAAQGLENQVYLALFSGSGNWWGNDLLFANKPVLRFSSETEQVLRKVALNSAGRQAIEEAVKNDTAFIKKLVPGTTISVTAKIEGDNRVGILVNIDGETFYYSITV